MVRWSTKPLPFLAECRAEFGDTFTLNLAGFGRNIFTCDPDLIKQIYTSDPNVLLAGKGNDILEPLLGPNSVLILDGARHARQRKLMMPPFHGRRMKAYGQIIADATERSIADWPVGGEAIVHEATQTLSLEVILRAVFGIEEGGLSDAARIIGETTDAATALVLFFPFLQRDLGCWSPGGKLARAGERSDALIQAEIDRRRSHPDDARDDILSLLMAARDEDGAAMSDVELRDQLLTLLAAGHETTATALSWALHWVLREPRVLDALLAELDAAPDDPESISRLPYLTAACRETLRIIPVIPITVRYAAAPITLGGIDVPVGVRLAPCIHLLHQREDLYPEADVFRPERFLERKFRPHEFIPFGGGNRRCLGAAFAEYEMRIALAVILRMFVLELVDSKTVPVRRNLTLTPKGGTRVKVLSRR